MRFGIKTLDEFDYRGKTVICRVDINQPVDRATGTLRSTTRIRACVPTIRELSDKERTSCCLPTREATSNIKTTIPCARTAQC